MNKNTKEKNKILIISLDFPPAGGGQGVYVENIARELANKNFYVSVLTTKSGNRKDYKFNIKEINYKGQNPLIFIIISYLYYLLKLKKEKYNIIHGNSINHLFFLIFKKSGIKYITTTHNTYLQRLKSKNQSLFYKIIYPTFIKLEKYVLRKSDRIIAVSKSTMKHIEKICNNKNVDVIENGVDIRRFRESNKDSDTFRFLYVGRLEIRKRVMETIKIFEEFIKQYKGNKLIEFIIIGDGPEFNNIKEYISKNNLKQIKLIGYSGEVEKYYKKSNCLLLLSQGEGLPLVLLEAISSGLAVITTKDASGLSGAIQSSVNGYVVNDELNSDEIVSKMNNTVSNFEKFSINSKDLVKSYDWGIIINKYIEIYNI